MEINFNLGSLKIVYDPLIEYFKKIQLNISNNIVIIKDEKKVATNFESIEIINKVQSTLKMIGLHGVVEVLQVAKDALKEVKEVKYDNEKTIKILQKIDSLFKDVSIYLETLLAGENDEPTKFYSQYKELSDLIGKTVSIRDLFFPKLDFSETLDKKDKDDNKNGIVINQETKSSIVEQLEKTIKDLDVLLPAISNVIANGGISAGQEDEYQRVCKDTYITIQVIERLKLSKQTYLLLGLQKLFVCINSPMFNDKFAEMAKADKKEILEVISEIKQVFVDILDDVNKMENGEKTNVIKVNDETVRKILFFIIQKIGANKHLETMPIYKEVSKYLNFSYYLSQLGDIKIESSLEQKDVNIATLIDKTMIDIKEEISLLTGKQNASIEYLEQHLEKFKVAIHRIDEVFNAKKVPLRDITITINDIVGKIKAKEVKFTELLQKEISLSILLLEYGINSFVKSVIKEQDREYLLTQVKIQKQRLIAASLDNKEELMSLPTPEIDEKNKANEERKTYLKIYAELANDFIKSEEILVSLIKGEDDNLSEIDVVYKTLKSARGIFAVMGKDDLISVINKIAKVWKQAMEKGINTIDKSTINQTISWLSGISLAIQAAKADNQVEANEMLENVVNKYTVFMNKTEPQKVEPMKPIVTETIELPTQELEFEIENDIALSITEETVPEISIPELSLENETPAMVIELPVEEIETTLTFENVELPEELLVQQEPVPETIEIVEEPVNKFVQLAEFEDLVPDEELLSLYLEESGDIFEQLEVSLENLEADFSNMEEITNIRRFFHTLKGSGKMVGLLNLGESAWIVEQTLNKVIANDIDFNKQLYDLIVYASRYFKSYSLELKESNRVIVDVKTLKANFYSVNKDIVNNFIVNIDGMVEENQAEVAEPEIDLGFNEEEIEQESTIINLEPENNYFEPEEPQPEPESLVEMVIEEPVQEEVVQEESEIEINGILVEKILYELYKEESGIHSNKMLEILEDLSNKESRYLPTGFILHAHTMGSISKSVNLTDCASIASKIETLANISVDKNVLLTQEEVNLLIYAVNHMNDLRTIESFNETNGYVDGDLLPKLEKLQDTLSERNDKPEVSHHAEIDMSELANIISNKVLESLDGKLNGLSSAIDALQKEVEQMKSDPSSKSKIEIDDNIHTAIISGISDVLENNFLAIAKTLDQNKYNTKEVVDEIFNKIDKVEIDTGTVIKMHKKSDESILGNIENIKKELKVFNEEIKKKSFLDFIKSLFK